MENPSSSLAAQGQVVGDNSEAEAIGARAPHGSALHSDAIGGVNKLTDRISTHPLTTPAVCTAAEALDEPATDGSFPVAEFSYKPAVDPESGESPQPSVILPPLDVSESVTAQRINTGWPSQKIVSEASSANKSLRFKVIAVAISGALTAVTAMYFVDPFISTSSVFAPHRTSEANTSTDPRSQTKSSKPAISYEDGLKLVQKHYAQSNELPDINSDAIRGDIKEIRDILNRAAVAGSLEAKYLLGFMYQLSGHKHQDRDARHSGAALIHDAASNGLYAARLDSALLLKTPMPLDQGHFQSAQKAAEVGFHIAQIDVARYFMQQGQKEEAVKWLEKALSNKKRPIELADPLLAFRLALVGSETTEMLAQYEGLAEYLLAMSQLDQNVDRNTAARVDALLVSASKKGILEAAVALAKLRLSRFYNDGAVVDAISPLLKLANSEPIDNACVMAFEECSYRARHEAMYLLAVNHLGETPGFEKVKDSILMLEELVKADNAPAKSLLAWCLLNGVEIKKNVQRALQLYEEADSAGDVEAKYWRGKILLEGKHLKKDHARAMGLLEEAADLGHTRAAELVQKNND